MKNVAYTLDGLGNRSQVLTTPPTPPSTVTYAADVVNQYTAVGGVARTHDNNGNLKDDGTYVFSYDFENRLVQVRQSGTLTLIADYHYDALGRRVEKVLAAGTTTRYLLDGVEVVEEYDAVGNWQARYVYEDGIDRPRCMDRADIADVNGNQNTTEVLRFHYHQQALGSVTEVTQPTGAPVEWVSYDVYGRPSVRDQQGNVIPQSAVGNARLYTGREYDVESGLYFYRARSYDSVNGRFLQRDPLHMVDGANLYAYCHSSPVSMYDPYGTDDTPKPEERSPVEGPDGQDVPGTGSTPAPKPKDPSKIGARVRREPLGHGLKLGTMRVGNTDEDRFYVYFRITHKVGCPEDDYVIVQYYSWELSFVKKDGGKGTLTMRPKQDKDAYPNQSYSDGVIGFSDGPGNAAKKRPLSKEDADDVRAQLAEKLKVPGLGGDKYASWTLTVKFITLLVNKTKGTVEHTWIWSIVYSYDENADPPLTVKPGNEGQVTDREGYRID